jgi:hypothetical protein
MGLPKLQGVEVSHCDKFFRLILGWSNNLSTSGQNVAVVNITGSKCHSSQTLLNQSVTVVKHYCTRSKCRSSKTLHVQCVTVVKCHSSPLVE